MTQLDIDIINRGKVYKVTALKEDLFQFHSEMGMVYEIGFLLDNPVGGCDTYQFSLNCTTSDRPPLDAMIRRTVLAILEEFFAKNDSVILYVCDTSDRRQKLRMNKFERWFNSYPHRADYVIMSACLVDEGVENYTSIIVKNTNPKLTDIVTDFTDTIKLLNQGKPV